MRMLVLPPEVLDSLGAVALLCAKELVLEAGEETGCCGLHNGIYVDSIALGNSLKTAFWGFGFLK